MTRIDSLQMGFLLTILSNQATNDDRHILAAIYAIASLGCFIGAVHA